MHIAQETLQVLAGHDPREDNIKALYDPDANIIYVPEGFDPLDLNNAYVIIHELVHYLQRVNGRREDCVAKLEPEAYEIQFRWQDEVGPIERETNWLYIYALIDAACYRDDVPHPVAPR